jgi:hypothetical protein
MKLHLTQSAKSHGGPGWQPPEFYQILVMLSTGLTYVILGTLLTELTYSFAVLTIEIFAILP